MKADILDLAVCEALLSPKEREVFNLLGRGMAVEEIASKLNKSPKTVDAQTQTIRHKLGLENRHELVCTAMRMSIAANR